jgi:hypothetical protein
MSCYCCVIGCGTIFEPPGDEGDVLGSCYNCHIHACGAHADRSADDAQFLCALCEPTLLTASAFKRTQIEGYTRQMLREYNGEHLLTLRRDATITSVQAFAWSHPRLWQVISSSSYWQSYEHGDGLTSRVREGLDQEGVRLLGAAVVLALALEMPRQDLPKILLGASSDLERAAPPRTQQR